MSKQLLTRRHAVCALELAEPSSSPVRHTGKVHLCFHRWATVTWVFTLERDKEFNWTLQRVCICR